MFYACSDSISRKLESLNESKMDKDTVISVENVSKKYCKSLKRSMFYGAIDIGKNMLGLSSRSDQLRKDEFWALKDISFEVKKGETLGIIGPNGSGKTTLLKLINGIFWPDKGKITIRGRVGALIELGAGFHPLLTGRENVYINAAILGMTKKEVDEKFNEIIEFADIGDFIDTPVKYYSSGMLVKLGFSVAIHSNPDIILVDEVLAVGDIQFQAKCFSKIREFKENGKSIVLVSHDMSTIQKHTGKVILLHKGSIQSINAPVNVINTYIVLMSGKADKESSGKRPWKIDEDSEQDNTYFIPDAQIQEDLCPKRANYNRNEFRYGNGFARIVDFHILNLRGEEITAVRSRDSILFRIEIKGYRLVEKPILGITVKTIDGIELYGINTLYADVEVPRLTHERKIVAEYKVNINLQPGHYFLSAGVAEITSEGIIPVDRRYDLVHIEVLPSDRSFGMVNLGTEIKILSEDLS